MVKKSNFKRGIFPLKKAEQFSIRKSNNMGFVLCKTMWPAFQESIFIEELGSGRCGIPNELDRLCSGVLVIISSLDLTALPFITNQPCFHQIPTNIMNLCTASFCAGSVKLNLISFIDLKLGISFNKAHCFLCHIKR